MEIENVAGFRIMVGQTSIRRAATVKILFLGANGLDTSRLRISTELREVQAEIERAKERRDIVVRAELAVRPADLQRLLLDEKPDVVHFSGHGVALRMPATARAGAKREFEPPGDLPPGRAAPGGAILLENQAGEAALVPADALTDLFKILKGARCVVLNACFSSTQAEALAEHVDAVIGMKREIGDDSAIAFAVGFYQALSRDMSVKEAFELGRNMIKVCDLPDADVPALYGGAGVRVSAPNRKAPQERTKSSKRYRRYRRPGCVVVVSFTATLVAAVAWLGAPVRLPVSTPSSGAVVVIGPGMFSLQGRRATSALCQALDRVARDGEPAAICRNRGAGEDDEGLREKASAAGASVFVAVDEAGVARLYPLATLANHDVWARGLPPVEIFQGGAAEALAPLLRELAHAAEERTVDRERLRCGESVMDEGRGIAVLTMFLRLKLPDCLSVQGGAESIEGLRQLDKRFALPKPSPSQTSTPPTPLPKRRLSPPPVPINANY